MSAIFSQSKADFIQKCIPNWYTLLVEDYFHLNENDLFAPYFIKNMSFQ